MGEKAGSLAVPALCPEIAVENAAGMEAFEGPDEGFEPLDGERLRQARCRLLQPPFEVGVATVDALHEQAGQL